jgi:uncharacterized membrane protein
MTMLILAAIVFVGSHILLSGTPLRGVLVKIVGETGFLALFSLIALAALVWMAWAYSDADYVGLWQAGHALKGIAWLVMVPAVILVVCGNATPNPSSVGSEKVLERENAAGGIFSVTRHPLMWGIAFWAGAHLLANGDLASVIFFLAILVLVFAGVASQEAKKRAKMGEAWDRFAADTSFLPFVAIAQGRRKLDWKGIGWWRIGLSLVVYAVLVLLHPAVIGVSPMPS